MRGKVNVAIAEVDEMKYSNTQLPRSRVMLQWNTMARNKN